MFNAECHCGNLKLAASAPPASITRCNCSMCNRLGALWAYYDEENVKVTSGSKPGNTYAWGEKTITYHRCGECGCTTHYTTTDDDGRELISVNCRMAQLSDIANIPVREFDGLVTWKYLDE
ncbi:MAG: aldehyde-activating protein [Gammaproteobacteria bacterium]|jgi:hypothetical protein|nr:aldehyde-activating protein [Gammaproteobacteria bacterium]